MESVDYSRGKLAMVLLTALPPAFFGLALALLMLSLVPLNKLVVGGPTPLIGLVPRIGPLVLGFVVLAALAIGALWAAQQGLPAWTHVWTTGGVVAVAFMLMLAADEREFLISPLWDKAVLFCVLACLTALALVAAGRSAAQAALVGMGFASSLSMGVTFAHYAGPFYRVDRALWVAPAGLAFSALLVAAVVGDRRTRSLAVVLCSALAGTLLWSYDLTITPLLPSPPAVRFFVPLAAIAAVGMFAPLTLAHLLQSWRQARAPGA